MPFSDIEKADSENTNKKDKIVMNVFRHLDTVSLVETAPLVKKNWNEIAKRTELKETRDLAKDRLSVFRRFHPREKFKGLEELKNETPDTIAVKRFEKGLTNSTFKLDTKQRSFVARLPGKGAETFVDRKSEAVNAVIASELKVGAEIVYQDDQGNQITKYLANPKTMSPEDFKDFDNIRKAAQGLKRIHESRKPFKKDVDIFDTNNKGIARLTTLGSQLPEVYRNAALQIKKIEDVIKSLHIKKVPCHYDTTPSNFLLSNGEMTIIDWEYSNNCDRIWDLAVFSMENNFTKEQDLALFQAYFGESWNNNLFQRFLVYKPVVEYWVSIWAQVQIANKNQPEKEHEYITMAERIANVNLIIESAEFQGAFKVLQDLKIAQNTKCDLLLYARNRHAKNQHSQIQHSHDDSELQLSSSRLRS